MGRVKVQSHWSNVEEVCFWLLVDGYCRLHRSTPGQRESAIVEIVRLTKDLTHAEKMKRRYSK